MSIWHQEGEATNPLQLEVIMKRKYEVTIEIDDLHGDCEVNLSDGEDTEIIYPKDLQSLIIMFSPTEYEGEKDILPLAYIVSSDVRNQIEQEPQF